MPLAAHVGVLGVGPSVWVGLDSGQVTLALALWFILGAGVVFYQPWLRHRQRMTELSEPVIREREGVSVRKGESPQESQRLSMESHPKVDQASMSAQRWTRQSDG